MMAGQGAETRLGLRVLGRGFCLLAVALAASSGAAKEAWQSLYGRNVVALYHERDRQAALEAVGAADELAARLQVDLGFKLDHRAEIILCSTHTEFEREAGHTLGVGVLGLAMPERDRVLVKALPPTALRNVTRHELAHLFMGKALGDYDPQAPRWLQEGAAKYYAEDWSADERVLLAGALQEGKLYTIAQLNTFPTNPDQAALAYAESYVLVKYLVSLDPSHGLAPYIANLKETQDVGRALRRAYGLSEAEANANLRDAIARQSRSLLPAWAVETAIFFVMALIFLFGYWRVRRRSREIRERMEQEELLDRLFEESRRRRRLWGPPP